MGTFERADIKFKHEAIHGYYKSEAWKIILGI